MFIDDGKTFLFVKHGIWTAVHDPSKHVGFLIIQVNSIRIMYDELSCLITQMGSNICISTCVYGNDWNVFKYTYYKLTNECYQYSSPQSLAPQPISPEVRPGICSSDNGDGFEPRRTIFINNLITIALKMVKETGHYNKTTKTCDMYQLAFLSRGEAPCPSRTYILSWLCYAEPFLEGSYANQDEFN